MVVTMFGRFSIWSIGIPKDALLRLVDAVDADQDGYVTVGEVRDLLKRYAKDLKASYKYRRH